ncbi:MAG: putative toxin-antitoxin system toxin component, PIN family [Chitinophagaceae bacterium]
MRVKKFVLDTNVWISYLITGREEELLKIKVSNKLSIFICEELLTEIKRVLEYPQVKKYGIDLKEALRFVRSFTICVEISYPIRQYIPGDPDDNYIIALALQTNSGFITSGDKHILSQRRNLEKSFKRLHILIKAEFENKFK